MPPIADPPVQNPSLSDPGRVRLVVAGTPDLY